MTHATQTEIDRMQREIDGMRRFMQMTMVGERSAWDIYVWVAEWQQKGRSPKCELCGANSMEAGTLEQRIENPMLLCDRCREKIRHCDCDICKRWPVGSPEWRMESIAAANKSREGQRHAEPDIRR